VVRAIGAEPASVRIDYAGLNHLGWLYGVHRLDKAGRAAASDSIVTAVPAASAGKAVVPAASAGKAAVPAASVQDAAGLEANVPAASFAEAAGTEGAVTEAALSELARAGAEPPPLTAGTTGGLLDGLFDDPGRLESIEEGRLFGASRLRELRAVPNEYLHYYYDAAGTLAAVRDAAQTRGEYLLGQQHHCYDEIAVRDPLEAWLQAWREREATYMAENRELAGAGEREHDESRPAGYEGVALAVMRALAHHEPATLILNVRNRGTLGVLDDEAVVEVPCTVDGNGAVPHRVAPLPTHGIELVRAVKSAERHVLEAARSGSRTAAIRAMAAHPLAGPEVAARLIDAYRAEFAELDYLRPDPRR
jgi:6-phospho-beta-glucosidase